MRPMTQRSDSILGVIEILRVVDNNATTLIPPIPCGLTRKLNSSADTNAHKSKSVLIYDNNSSSSTGCNCMDISIDSAYNQNIVIYSS